MAIESSIRIPAWRDYLAMAKPRVVGLHILTAATTMFLAAGGVPRSDVLLFTLVGGSMVAGSSNALNCYLDRDLDKTMPRTSRRPLPAGRLKPFQACLFSAFLGGGGLIILSQLVSWFAAWLALGALAYYVVVYTMFLKRRTYWSSILGSGAGAFPPLIGWVAVTGRIELTPFLLFAIVVLWTPPHFWSLGILRRAEYQDAGLEVIPSTNAPSWILLSSICVVAVSLLTAWQASLGWLYVSAAAIAGLGILILSARLFIKAVAANARRLFQFSILHLAVVFTAMLLDKIWLG
jgi:heme o synthase